MVGALDKLSLPLAWPRSSTGPDYHFHFPFHDAYLYAYDDDLLERIQSLGVAFRVFFSYSSLLLLATSFRNCRVFAAYLMTGGKCGELALTCPLSFRKGHDAGIAGVRRNAIWTELRYHPPLTETCSISVYVSLDFSIDGDSVLTNALDLSRLSFSVIRKRTPLSLESTPSPYRSRRRP